MSEENGPNLNEDVEQDASEQTKTTPEEATEASPEVEVAEQPEQEAQGPADAADADEQELDAADAQEEGEASEDAPQASSDNKKKRQRRQSNSTPDVSRELKRLVELATKFPEIGAPLAQLSTKLGYQAFADRLLNMGLEDEARGVEYFIVAANLARKEGRSQDVLDAVLAGLRDFASSEEVAPDISSRLLHLVRLGFAV
ncbi:MAG: hypothetical protein VX475_04310, partial [Myxococcota bacterium]|nr:hypothetical protein [Myxococcota bacterium]